MSKNWVIKSPLYMSMGTFSRKLNFWKSSFLYFQKAFRRWAKNIRTHGEKLSTSLSKLLSTFPQQQFEDQYIFGKKINSSWLWVEKFRNFDENFSAALSKMHSTYPDECFRKKPIFWLIPDFDQKILDRQGFQNYILHVQTKVLRFSKFFPNRENKLPMLAFSVNAIGNYRVITDLPFEWMILLS